MTAVLGVILMMPGCATTEGRIIAAADTKGKAEARVNLPDQPEECARHMARVVPKVGDKSRWIQAQWEVNADAIDNQIDGCNGPDGFYPTLKSKLERR
jgi:hypothetical protein